MKRDAAFSLSPHPESAGTRAPQWLTLHTRPLLGSDDVHVWRAHVPTVRWMLPYLLQILSAEERERAEALRCVADRQQFIVGRASLRFILAEYLDARATDIAFDFGLHGKPTLTGPLACDGLEFNLSHSADWVICAIARGGCAVGVDVERRREGSNEAGIAARMFSAAERDEVRQAQGQRRTERFFDIWTRKEACIKALGQDVFSAFAPVQPGLKPGMTPDLQTGSAETFPDYGCVHPLAIADGYSAALAVAGVRGPTMFYECGSVFLIHRLRSALRRAAAPAGALAASAISIPCMA